MARRATFLFVLLVIIDPMCCLVINSGELSNIYRLVGPTLDHVDDMRRAAQEASPIDISKQKHESSSTTSITEAVNSVVNSDIMKKVRQQLCDFTLTLPDTVESRAPWFLGRKVAALYAEALGSNTDEATDVYTFGVMNGGTMMAWHQFMPASRQWGFDSFTGLPPESHIIDPKSFDPDWKVGAFKSNLVGTDGLVDQGLVNQLGGKTMASFIKGYFNESLKPNLSRELGMRQAAIIDIDSDLYVSAHQALDWVFASGLARKGTLIVYDEFKFEGRIKNGEFVEVAQRPCLGECLAHVEIAKKYDVHFTQVSGEELAEPEPNASYPFSCSLVNLPGYVRAFVVDSVGRWS